MSAVGLQLELFTLTDKELFESSESFSIETDAIISYTPNADKSTDSLNV